MALFRGALFGTAFAFSYRRTKTAEAAIGQITQNRAFMLTRYASGRFFATVNGVAKHLGHDCRSAKKVHLKPVRLFFCTRLRVDAFNI